MKRLICWTGLAMVVAAAAATPAQAGGGGGCPYGISAPGESAVVVADFCFLPGAIEIETGDTVRWQLQAEAPHTVRFTDAAVDSGQLAGDFAIRFNEPGVYEYFCTIHPAMTGSVTATGSSQGGPALEVADAGAALGSDATRSTTLLDDAVPMRVELSPITALTIIAVLFPLTLAAAMRLVDARPRSRLRLRLPFEVGSRDVEPRSRKRR
jgi:plastocyanin